MTGGIIALEPSDLYDSGYSIGVRVFSNSWGTSYRSGAHYEGANTDMYLYDHTDVIIIFAAGNDGAGGAGTCSMESQLKNVVSVGSSQSTLNSENIDYVSWFSSRGPSFDKRIKPDIVAPGDSLRSAKANSASTLPSNSNSNSNSNHAVAGGSCDTVIKSGTSMAAPVVAGSALLIRQYFIDERQRFWTQSCRPQYNRICRSTVPSGVLLKAAILHSGTSASMVGVEDSDSAFYYYEVETTLSNTPDNFQGYGRVFLQNILPLKGKFDFDLYFDDLRAINENSDIVYYVNVLDSTRPLKVTLSWYDPPGIDGLSTQSLIHDLDLRVDAPPREKRILISNNVTAGKGNDRGSNSSNEIEENAKEEEEEEEDGVLLGNNRLLSEGPDKINNNEQIFVGNPRAGQWTVTVSTKALPYSGQQHFSIVITSNGEVSDTF